MSQGRAVAAGLALLGLWAAAWGVGPPAAGPVRLSREQEARLSRLDAARDQAADSGEMGRALRLAQEVESLRRRWQGAGHWEAVDARYEVERWGRLARLPEAAQREAARAERRQSQATSLHGRARYAEAEKALRDALGIYRKVLGEEHPESAQVYNNIASCLEAQGRLAQAQPLYEKALAIFQKALGDEHPLTAATFSNLAGTLQAQGRLAQALPLFEKALAIRGKVLGEGHPETAASYNNVAYCLDAQGKVAQALPLFEKALANFQKALGAEHPKTATGYSNVAGCLKAQGQLARARPLYEKALAIKKKALGDEHPDTATGYINVASCLLMQGQSAQALPLHEKALAIFKKALGEEHPMTATGYSNVASCLEAGGQLAQAQPLYERALAIRRKVLGEGHPDTAASFNNLASCLAGQGKLGQAQPLYERALAIRRKVLGEEHSNTAMSYNNLAFCLEAQGKPGQARPLYEKALAIKKKVLGDEHPETATIYSNLASCLQSQSRPGQARPLYEKALAIKKKALGDEHPETATIYNNLAYCLQEQNRPAEARPLHERALAIRRKVLGEEHPHTAVSYNNVASCLSDQGRPAQAQPLAEKAVAIFRKALAEEHPDTAQSYTNLGFCLYEQGRYREAIANWQRALLGHDHARLARGESGFDRARFGADSVTPRVGLALAHARLKEPEKAWAYAEADRARNLLDDLAGAAGAEAALSGHLRRLDERLLPLFGRGRLSDDQKALRDELTRQRGEALQRLAKAAGDRSAALVWSLKGIQEQLPADGAVVLWVSVWKDTWACVLRQRGAPRWEQLAGTGPKGVWGEADYAQPPSLYAALGDVRSPAARRRELTEAVRRRWLAPLERHLGAEGKMPAVRRLFVAPSRHTNWLPVEVLAPGYTVSYTPSATVLAQALKGHRALKASPALALGDPVFRAPAAVAPPTHGVLVGAVVPGGPADKAGMRAGDVLVRYDNTKLVGVSDLAAAVKKNAKGTATYWREGKETTVPLPMPLGLRVDRRPAPEAVKAFREANAPVVRGGAYAELKGTRAEVGAIRRLLGEGCRTLLGSEASEQALDALTKDLTRFRVLHLATHGEVNLARPEHSRLILARDRLPTLGENADRVSKGLRPYSGELTVDTILREWRLDADLVVLSACQTGLGRASTGDGLLGFPYALMRAGARSVVLSRWKVDDGATALLMVRFYENLLGKAKGLRGPLGRAEALAEAKRWLRELPRQEAERLAGALKADRLSGTRGSIVELAVKERPKVPGGDRPYEHPFYWAAFTLIGDPG